MLNPENYRILRSRRKSLAVEITPEGEVVVRCPMKMPLKTVYAFLAEKSAWIEAHLQKVQNMEKLPRITPQQLALLKQQAGEILPERTAFFAEILGVTYGRITIRSQKTRWGSCSRDGNLSFNCLLILVPPEVLDYVVVHELCHRKQMNHSAAFWREVENILPDYRQRREWLKEHGGGLIAGLT